jgi:hypothetical protein
MDTGSSTVGQLMTRSLLDVFNERDPERRAARFARCTDPTCSSTSRRTSPPATRSTADGRIYRLYVFVGEAPAA